MVDGWPSAVVCKTIVFHNLEGSVAGHLEERDANSCNLTCFGSNTNKLNVYEVLILNEGLFTAVGHIEGGMTLMFSKLLDIYG